MAERVIDAAPGGSEQIEALSTPGGTADGKAYLTPGEAAKKLGVSRQTVEDWLQLGRLRGLRTGKRWRVLPQDIEAFRQPYEVWREQFEQTVEEVRGRIPREITSEEIESEISAECAAVRSQNRARRR
jgi:excisionase family DNA binding protein